MLFLRNISNSKYAGGSVKSGERTNFSRRRKDFLAAISASKILPQSTDFNRQLRFEDGSYSKHFTGYKRCNNSLKIASFLI